MSVIYKYLRSGKIEEMKFETLQRAMGLAALNFRESIEPIEIIDGEKSYNKQQIAQYIKQFNLH